MSEEQSLKAHVRALGCKVNQVEAEELMAELMVGGMDVVPQEDASVIVVRTCSVTSEADAKARKAVRQALASPSTLAVVVAGCGAVFDREGFEAIDPRVTVEPDTSKVASRVGEILHHVPEEGCGGIAIRAGGDFHTRVMVMVEDGCDSFCTYCIVPHLRGRPKSRTIVRILDEIAALLDEGTREIVLTGVNIGRWHQAHARILDLLRAVVGTFPPRLRISSIEPTDVPDILPVFSETAALCPHLHVPLQSGSDSVLQGMGRPYTAARYEEIASAAKEAVPGLALTTDVIVGFPGETDEDFEATMELVRRLGFAKLHVFRYSLRKGTPAAEMPEQVPAEVKAERSERMRALGDELREAFERERIGTTSEVLLETELDGGEWEGTTPDYIKVRARCEGCSAGDIVPVTLKDVADGHMTGEQSGPPLVLES